MRRRTLLWQGGLLLAIAAAFVYNAHRNARAREQLEAAKEAIGSQCRAQFRRFAEWFPDGDAEAAICEAATDGLDVLRARTSLWRWNLGVGVPWPASRDKWARVAQVVSRARERCPDLIQKAAEAARAGEPTEVLALGAIHDVCDGFLPSMLATATHPPVSSQEASVWEWAELAGQANATWQAAPRN